MLWLAVTNDTSTLIGCWKSFQKLSALASISKQIRNKNCRSFRLSENMGSEKFCLRWNDFENNISSAFKELRDDKSFFDVTLACDDEQIQAHKVILSACSPFFRNILRRNPHQHPLLYLKGVKYSDLQSVLNFMYHGEVNVAQEELNSFLAVAEDLRIKGLTQNHSENPSKSGRKSLNLNPTVPPPQKAQSRLPDRDPHAKRPFQDQALQPTFSQSTDDDIQEVVPVKSEPKDAPPVMIPPTQAHQPQQVYSTISPQVNSQSQALATPEDQVMGYDDSYEDYGQYGEDTSFEDGVIAQGGNSNSKGVREILHQYIEKVAGNVEIGKYMCTLCGKTNGQKIQTENHVESMHFPGTIEYPCKHCGIIFTGRNKLYIHVNRMHKQKN